MKMMTAKLMNWKYSLQGKGKWDGEVSKSSFNFRWLDLTDLLVYYAWLIHFQLYPAFVKVCCKQKNLNTLKNTVIIWQILTGRSKTNSEEKLSMLLRLINDPG